MANGTIENARRRRKMFLPLLGILTCLCTTSVSARRTEPSAYLEFETRTHDVTSSKDAISSFPNTDEAPHIRNLRTRTLQSKGGTSTESTHVNIFQKLKESLGKTLIGILLICVTPCLLWWNEGRHVKELKRIEFCKENAVGIDPNNPLEDQVGELVHFTGPVSADGAELGTGDGFGVNVAGALVVKRTCFVYQKFEHAEEKTDRDRIGGGETRTVEYSVREDWATVPQPSTLEHLEGETNSSGIWDGLMSATGDSQAMNMVVSPKIHVGEFGLTKEIILENPAEFLSSWDQVSSDLLPEAVDGCEGLERGDDHVLRTFPQSEQPQNGDCKVVFEYVAEGFDCSFLVRQTVKYGSADAAPSDALLGANNDTQYRYGVDKMIVVDTGLCKFKAGDLGKIWMVQKGTHDIDAMIQHAKEKEQAIFKIVRVGGCVGMVAGWTMLFAPFITALQVLPLLSGLAFGAVLITALIVSCLCSFTIVTLAYVRYRPLLGMGLLALAAAIWGIVIWRLDTAAKTGGTPQ